jgi:hypothetical protein
MIRPCLRSSKGVFSPCCLYSTRQSLETINSLVAKRLPDLGKELSRLKGNPRVTQSLDHINAYHRYGLVREQQIAVGRSLELQEHLKKDYYVINHGQNNDSVIVNIVAKKALEIFQQKTIPSQILRHPVFLENSTRDLSWFKENLHMGNQDLNYSPELISGDLILEHLTSSESAIDFFTGTPNMLNGPRMVRSADGRIQIVKEKNYQEKIVTKIVQHHIVDKNLAALVSKKVMHIGRSLQDGGGTLYSICIPKEKFSSIGYLAKSFGRAITKNYTQEELEGLQNGVFTPPEGSLPQVRLLTKKLNLEEGVLITSNSTLNDKRIKEVEGQVEDCFLQAKH